MTRRHVTFRGAVQGVGFRWFVKETADEMGLAGWVRNLEDGSVEAEIEGETAKLDEFLKRSKTGNRSARVDEIAVQTRDAKNESTFRII